MKVSGPVDQPGWILPAQGVFILPACRSAHEFLGVESVLLIRVLVNVDESTVGHDFDGHVSPDRFLHRPVSIVPPMTTHGCLLLVWDPPATSPRPTADAMSSPVIECFSGNFRVLLRPLPIHYFLFPTSYFRSPCSNRRHHWDWRTAVKVKRKQEMGNRK